jgi:hypothetical protein
MVETFRFEREGETFASRVAGFVEIGEILFLDRLDDVHTINLYSTPKYRHMISSNSFFCSQPSLLLHVPKHLQRFPLPVTLDFVNSPLSLNLMDHLLLQRIVAHYQFFNRYLQEGISVG